MGPKDVFETFASCLLRGPKNRSRVLCAEDTLIRRVSDPVVKYDSVNTPGDEANLAEPIGVWASLVAGFERVAARPVLIIPLLVLDLLLWFGPHLSLAKLVPEGTAWLAVPDASDPAIAGQLEMVGELLNILRERFNLVSALSSLPGGMPFNLLVAVGSLPAGLPSLMAGQLPIRSPLGSAPVLYPQSPSQVLLLWAVLTGVGLGLGVVYHRWLAREAAPEEFLSSSWLAWVRMVVLFLIAYAGGLLTLTFVVLVASLLGLIHPMLSTVFIIMGIGLLFWAAIYLGFTTHGIIRYDFGVFRAMLESASVVRGNLLSTTGFLFVAFLLVWFSTTEIWSLPDERSWYNLLSILGHAFLSSTLIVASYAFYQSRRVRARQSRAMDQPGGVKTPGQGDLDA